MATSSMADIFQSEQFFMIFYGVSEIYVKFGVIEKKDQSQSLGITEIINCKTGSYLKIQKAMFHARIRQITR